MLAVLTAQDVPHNKVGHIQQDWDVMIAQGDITRCVGDAICLVVAQDEATLEKAKKLVKIQYQPLEPVRNIREAMAPMRPRCTPGQPVPARHVTRGDAKAAIAASKYVVTQTYRPPSPSTPSWSRRRGGLPLQGRGEGVHQRPGRVRHP